VARSRVLAGVITVVFVAAVVVTIVVVGLVAIVTAAVGAGGVLVVVVAVVGGTRGSELRSHGGRDRGLRSRSRGQCSCRRDPLSSLVAAACWCWCWLAAYAPWSCVG
jgi:hypothetical protein